MEHIFETVYPDYIEFKENIFHINNEYILKYAQNNYYNSDKNYTIVCKIKTHEIFYIDIYGNFLNERHKYGAKNINIMKNGSYFNFFMYSKFPNLNLVTFYEDNTDLIERIKEHYHSLPKVKKEEEEKNKFEEIQKELKELKEQLKIKDEEILKIKDDLNNKNDILRKILTKL